MTVEEIESALGYYFSDKSLLNRALTRKTFALEEKQQNRECEDQEIFRTLGDAVLKLVLVDKLIENGVETRGEITKQKIHLEREENLARISLSFGIGSFINMGIGEKKQKANEEPYVLAETLEAVIGAIYLDGRYDECRKTIINWFESFKIDLT
ncbi:MAG: dsRNA-specific ribonuclease [Candidatus Methanoperedenaceae archaeon]|nr:dsRNA-specific ribonuclease [Candidatus Methanoperedenaceae archaeon]MDW7727875.1 ribonuclease III domain-containing protein [Candidatus Methanoperedens sp.]